MVERLFVGVRGLFQSFAAACKYAYFAVASLQPSDKTESASKPCMARSQWSEGMWGEKRKEEGDDTEINKNNGKGDTREWMHGDEMW